MLAAASRVCSRPFSAPPAGRGCSCCVHGKRWCGDAIEDLAARRDVPVLCIDAPMAAEAAEAVRLVSPGGTISVLATVRTTLDPTANLIRRTAEREGKAARVDAVLVEGTYEALRAGNGEEHDRRVGVALRELLERADVLALAQASMAACSPRCRSRRGCRCLPARSPASRRLARAYSAESTHPRSASTVTR